MQHINLMMMRGMSWRFTPVHDSPAATLEQAVTSLVAMDVGATQFCFTHGTRTVKSVWTIDRAGGKDARGGIEGVSLF